MQTLRNAHLLARLVLVWFVLFVGVSVASPLVNPDGVQLVCSTAGSVKLVSSDAGAQSGLDDSERGHSMHCPLCLPLAMPPAVTIEAWVHVGLSFALDTLERARLASLVGLPWQARAPPSFS